MSAVRKTVTVLFCDLVGSTALADDADPEVVRERMRRYHAELRQILENHGGTVEKFIGDAVMAVFGLPQVHEDDALRAVRAAAEMRQAVEKLGLQVRIGVNTGTVVAGEGESLVTGDAVNVAARLEQAAALGEILLGEQTQRLAADAVRAEAVRPLSLKGKAAAVSAFRLLEVFPDVPAFGRRIDAPFVGRASELRELEAAFRQAVDERSCRLCTIVGPPGIGKSRLARELLERVDAQVLVGRCLPYGEGITYWPLAEMLGQLRSTVAEIVSGEHDAGAIAMRIDGAVGAARDVGAAEEIAWAFRKLFEALARERPLVVVVDDIHWAEPTLLDLLEYVASFAADAPLLLLSLARPDLFERRPSWASLRRNALVLSLEPLSDDESRTLAQRLVAARRVSDTAQEQLLETAEGNPLFVEQLVAMHAEDGERDLQIPPTIQALLAARIDRLEPDERNVVECAAVEGRTFHRSAVAELLAEHVRPALGSHLMALVRKEFIGPDRAHFPGDDGFRFGHILIRDAAYESLPKRLRGELHERYADWLERKAADRSAEFEEFVGYHLEQAYRYGLELGASEERLRKLGGRAGERLGVAGKRALDRVDLPAAENLLERALAVLPTDHRRRLEFNLARCDTIHGLGDLERAARLFEKLTAAASAACDAQIEWRARIALARIGLDTLKFGGDDADALARQAVDAFTELGDDTGLARAWELACHAANLPVDNDRIEKAIRLALRYAGRAGDARLVADMTFWFGWQMFWGRVPTREALAMCAELEASAATPLQRANALHWTAALKSLAGDARAQKDVALARSTYADVGLRVLHSRSLQTEGAVDLVHGDLAAAEAVLREADTQLEHAGESGYRCTVLALLASALCEQGRFDEAAAVTERSAAIAPDDDARNMALVSALRYRIAARQGLVDAAAQALSTFQSVDSPLINAEAFMLIARAKREMSDVAESQSMASRALADYEHKQVPAGVERAMAFLDDVARGSEALSERV
jgi:class 3 adenylate cyclase/tetratricopeptide (TPR) repeat protein